MPDSCPICRARKLHEAAPFAFDTIVTYGIVLLDVLSAEVLFSRMCLEHRGIVDFYYNTIAELEVADNKKTGGGLN